MLKLFENHPGIVKLYLYSKFIGLGVGILLLLLIITFAISSTAKFGSLQDAMQNFTQGMADRKTESDAFHQETGSLLGSMTQQYQDAIISNRATMDETRTRMGESEMRGDEINSVVESIRQSVEGTCAPVPPDECTTSSVDAVSD